MANVPSTTVRLRLDARQFRRELRRTRRSIEWNLRHHAVVAVYTAWMILLTVWVLVH